MRHFDLCTLSHPAKFIVAIATNANLYSRPASANSPSVNVDVRDFEIFRFLPARVDTVDGDDKVAATEFYKKPQTVIDNVAANGFSAFHSTVLEPSTSRKSLRCAKG